MTNYTWTGVGDASTWSNFANWNLDSGTPGASDNALINVAAEINAGSDTIVDNVTFSVDELLKTQSELNGTLTGKLQTLGSFSVLGDDDVGSTYTLTLEDHGVVQASAASSSSAAVTIDNGGSLFVDDSTLDDTLGTVLVGNTGQGTLTIESGGAATLQNTGKPVLVVGDDDLLAGSVVVEGAGSTLGTTGGDDIIGNTGQGVLDVFNGGQVTVGDGLILGAKRGANGTVQVGNTGDAAGPQLTITSGALVVGEAGTGKVQIEADGEIDDKASTGGVIIASAANSFGDLDDQGTLIVAAGVVVGAAAEGTMQVEGGGTATVGSLEIAELSTSGNSSATASEALVTGAGSKLSVTGAVTVGDAGFGALVVANGANFTASGSALEMGAQTHSNGTVTVEGAGSSLDASNLAIGGTTTVAGGTGSLIAETGGAVNISGNIEIWSGAISVDSKSLVAVGGAATVATGFDVTSAGTVTGAGSITGAIENDGEIVASGGALVLKGAVSGSGTEIIDAGATLDDFVSVSSAQKIDFVGGSGATWGTLDLVGEGKGVTVSAPITGFGGAGGTATTSDVIEVATSGIADDQVKWSQNGASGTLEVVNGSTVLATLTLQGTYNPKQFSLIENASDDQIVDAPCYCRGTRILTARGEVVVEDLRIGDLAITTSGRRRPIRWIGHRRIDFSRHPEPAVVRPVRVSAGAFGEGLPRRDLWLSPGHSVAFEGALMPIEKLLNGVSVAQVARSRVEYWHVELDEHDILLAEGLPAESYLDCGNRTGFANGGAFVEAHPDFRPKLWRETCLPLALEGREISRARARLDAELVSRGYEIAQDADAHVLVDGRRIDPISPSRSRLNFVLPAGGKSIALKSAVFVPASLNCGSKDYRELGLCVRRLRVDGETIALENDAVCGSGWRNAAFIDGRFEHRWTAGSAMLPAGARVIIVDLAGSGRYWRQPARGATAFVAGETAVDINAARPLREAPRLFA